MNKVTWQVWIDDDLGNRLALVDDAIGFSISKVANAPGAMTLTLADGFDRALLKKDGMVEFWRQREGALKLVGVYLMRRTRLRRVNGQRVIVVSGYDGLELLERRIVAYAAGSSQASVTNQADDMIKDVVRENLGASATDGDRDWSDRITVAADLTQGPSITKKFSWRNVLAVCQEIASVSKENGTPLWFDMVPYEDTSGRLVWKFVTYTEQIGEDHTGGSGSPVYFGEEFGNLDNPELDLDYTREATVVYAGGQGTEEAREVVEVEDAGRTAESAWGRREVFVDSRDEVTTAGITDDAQNELEALRGRKRFSGSLRDTDDYQFLVHWRFGDRVTVDGFGTLYDGMILAWEIGMQSGVETLSVRVEVDA